MPRPLLPKALAAVGRRVVCLPLVLEHEMVRTCTASQHPVPGPADAL